MIIELPFPPSLNTYWRHIGSRTLLSAKGRQYREDVQASVWAALGLTHVTLTGRLRVSLLLNAPTRQKRDIDNYPKAVLDGLQHAGVFADDEQIDVLEIVRGEVKKDSGVVVQIVEIEP